MIARFTGLLLRSCTSLS